MLPQLPAPDATGEARRVRLHGRKVYIRQWRPLDHGYYLVEYTNASTAKSKAWKWAIVTARVQREWVMNPASGRYEYMDDPSGEQEWFPVASVLRGTTHGAPVFRIYVTARDDEDMPWRWSTKGQHRDYETARDWMLGIAEVMYGVEFARV